MGGNALKNVKTKRLLKHDYELIKLEVAPKLLDLINVPAPVFDVYDEQNCVPFYIIPAYRTKESFGDMDIVLNKAYYDITDMESFLVKLKEVFGYTDIYVNKPVISIDYKEFQIDLIFMEQEYMKSSLYYYSYNDLGNFMGRIAVVLGVRFGHFGLKYVLKSEDNSRTLGEYYLTTDMRKSFEYLGFDFDEYLRGFDTLEDVFEYTISSKYFKKDIFALENLDHQNRTRNRKRDSYCKFLDYIEPKTFNEIEIPTTEEKMERLIKTFPELEIEKKIQEFKEEDEKHRQIKEKFNGKIVMELIPELKGDELGTFIKEFKFNSMIIDFDKYVLDSTNEIIRRDITFFYNECFKK